MTPSPKTRIDAFLAQKHVAVAGYSKNRKKFGTIVFNTLKKKGFNVYPVNPSGGTTPEGQEIFKDLTSLPGHVKALVVVTRPEISLRVVNQAIQQGIDNIWIQQMSDNKDITEMLELAGINHVTGRCILLHAKPDGIHKMHRLILEICGRLPK